MTPGATSRLCRLRAAFRSSLLPKVPKCSRLRSKTHFPYWRLFPRPASTTQDVKSSRYCYHSTGDSGGEAVHLRQVPTKPSQASILDTHGELGFRATAALGRSQADSAGRCRTVGFFCANPLTLSFLFSTVFASAVERPEEPSRLVATKKPN